MKGNPTKIKIARTKEELEAYFLIRRRVFVGEQKLFEESDKDEFDSSAIPLIGEVNNNIVGTVRIYPLSDTTWMGGRLAVLKEFRVYSVGRRLVKEAIKIVKEQGCTEFLAYIQPQNLRFFKKLGWNPVGKEVHINGCIHQVMQADLSKG